MGSVIYTRDQHYCCIVSYLKCPNCLQAIFKGCSGSLAWFHQVPSSCAMFWCHSEEEAQVPSAGVWGWCFRLACPAHLLDPSRKSICFKSKLAKSPPPKVLQVRFWCCMVDPMAHYYAPSHQLQLLSSKCQVKSANEHRWVLQGPSTISACTSKDVSRRLKKELSHASLS